MIRFKRLPEDIMQRVEGLKEFLEKKPEVIFAYLFGGLTKEKPSPLSDVDIAIYVKDPTRFDYLKFYGEITDFLGTDEVDIVMLNKAPISLTGRILYSKRLLVDKEPFLRHRFRT
jgi:predicted nucleotidyltransferase